MAKYARPQRPRPRAPSLAERDVLITFRRLDRDAVEMEIAERHRRVVVRFPTSALTIRRPRSTRLPPPVAWRAALGLDDNLGRKSKKRWPVDDAATLHLLLAMALTSDGDPGGLLALDELRRSPLWPGAEKYHSEVVCWWMSGAATHALVHYAGHGAGLKGSAEAGFKANVRFAFKPDRRLALAGSESAVSVAIAWVAPDPEILSDQANQATPPAPRREAIVPLKRGELPAVAADKPDPFAVPLLHLSDDRFLGRQDAIWQVHDALAFGTLTPLMSSAGAFVAISGSPGVGKSQLALEYAHRFAPIYPGGVLWIDAETTTPEQAAMALSAAIGIAPRFDATGFGALDWVWKQLRKRDPSLVVLDNFPPPNADQSSLAKWFPATGGVHVLLTTRLADLGRTVPHGRVLLDVLTQAEAVALLREAVPPPSDSGPSDEQGIAACSRIADALGYLPIALEMAAAHLRSRPTLTYSSYLDAIAQIGALQAVEESASRYPGPLSTGRSPGILGAFAAGWPEDTLERLIMDYLACLACAPVPIAFLRRACRLGVEAAPTNPLTDPVDDALAGLVQRSLLKVTDGCVRAHTLVLGFARARQQQEVLDETRGLCHAVMMDIAEDEPPTPAVLSLRAALFVHAEALALEAIRTKRDDAVFLAMDLADDCIEAGRPEDANRWARAADAAAGKMGGEKGEKLAIDTGRRLGECLRALGRHQEAIATFAKSLELLKKYGQEYPDSMGGLVTMATGMARAQIAAGQSKAAASRLREAVNEGSVQLGDGHVAVNQARVVLAEALLELGKLTEARELLEDSAERLERACGDKSHYTAAALESLGNVFLVGGHVNDALDCLKRALYANEAALGKDHIENSWILDKLALASAMRGRVEDAQMYARRALDIVEQAPLSVEGRETRKREMEATTVAIEHAIRGEPLGLVPRGWLRDAPDRGRFG